jgi:hypothetical protein
MKHDFAFSVRPGLRSRVTPAKAGGLALTSSFWIPSFAGMTETVTQSSILDQPGKSFFFCPLWGKKYIRFAGDPAMAGLKPEPLGSRFL